MAYVRATSIGSWWPQQLLIGWLNMVLTAPLIYVFIGLPLVMRQYGWSGTEIGMIQLTGLPALLKFLLATPIDRWRLGSSSYRHWAMILGLGYVVTLLALSAHDLRDTSYALLFVLALLVSLMGTWVDMPVNAMAMLILPESERLRAGAIRATATSLGAIIGGGLMLLLHAQMGWAWPFYVLSLGILSGVVLLPLMKVKGASALTAPVGASRASMRQWLAWFVVPQHRVWAVLLILYYPLIGTVWVFLKPLMLDLGFEPEQVALYVGVGGGGLAAIASLAGGFVSRQYGIRVVLPLFAALSFVALGGMTASLLFGLGGNALMAAAMFVALMMGASGGLVFGLMMYHARPELLALDYGIQSSLFVLGRTMLPVFAGLLLDHLGYLGLFACLMVGMSVMVVCLLYWLSRPQVNGMAVLFKHK